MTATLIAFHGSQKVKTKYLNRVKKHRLADQLIKGKYWEGGKGCAVGCTIHSNQHSYYEDELGISQILAQLEDQIFEGLPNEQAMTWPERFLKAIKPGADLSLVWRRFLLWLMEDAEYGSLKKCNPAGAKATKAIIRLYKRELKGENIPYMKYRAAADAANAAARAAANAAYAAARAAAYAAYAADAAYAAYAAYAANVAAANAAYAAANAAYAAAAPYVAAKERHFVIMSDRLIELLEACE